MIALAQFSLARAAPVVARAVPLPVLTTPACAVRLLHGQSDPDVPWEYSLQIAAHLEAPEVITTLIKGGVEPRDACRMSLVRPITDDADIRDTLDHAIDATFA